MNKKYLYSKIDITNQRFGRLTAVKKTGISKWLFRCDCGSEIELPYSYILCGQKSCGCLRKDCKDAFGENAKKHGGSGSNIYQRYCAIKSRCYNQNNHEYHRYGGRGIKMCEEWLNSFESFRDWAYKNGYDPKTADRTLSIDRIDNDGDYTPENCRFVTAKEQALNKENTIVCEYDGKKYSSWGFAKEYGITSPSFASKRLKAGISPEKILDEWKKTKELPQYLITVKEASLKYGKTEGHIRRMLNQGKLKGERINWKWYVLREQ